MGRHTVDALRYAPFGLATVVLLAACGLWCLWRRKAGAWQWLLASFGLLVLLSSGPFATLFIGTLEWQTPRFAGPPQGEQAIVVLSAGVQAPDPPQPALVPDFKTYIRCRHAAWLYHHGWRLPVIVTGGNNSAGHNLASVMAEVLSKEGVAPEDLLQEGSSESTYENARLVARLLAPRGIRRILLVTEAYHMPRSRIVFERAGFDVVPSACLYHTRIFGHQWTEWLLPEPSYIVLCDDAFHEWAGLLTYWPSGRL